MNRDQLVSKIVDEFRKLEQEILQLDPAQRPVQGGPWTKEILTTLCKLGKKLNYKPWASGRAPNRVPDEYGNGCEKLYDASWWKLDAFDRLISVPMVAESEWGKLEKIEEDFQKLLLTRAEVRVMVYYAKGLQRAKRAWNQIYRDRLCELVGAFNGKQRDTYLLVAFLNDEERGEGGFKFKFYQITDQGPGNQPELKKL